MSVRRASLAALLVACLAGLPACGSGEGSGGPGGAGGGPPPPVVEVLRLAPSTIRGDADLLGQLEALESVTVRPRASGTIEEIAFEEGERVQEGDLLFRLDDDAERAALRERQADLALAEDTHRRTRDLASREIVSEARVEQVAAELETARARVEAAQVALEYTRIRAPFDGLAGSRRVSPGARVEPEDALVTVESIETLELVFTLPEQVLPLARTGIDIEVIVSPYPEERFPGTISFVAPSLNPQNRRLLVKARIPNEDLRLRPGLFAQVEARLAAREGLVVPSTAIVYGSEGSFVWRLDEDDSVEQVGVELGVRRGAGVEVRSGLSAGDRIVVAGTNKLSPGVRVEAVSASREADPELPDPVAGPDREEAPGDDGEVAS